MARLFILVLGITTLNTTFAADEEIKNVRITADDDYLNMLWDPVTSDVLDASEGYALQWSDRQSDVKNNLPANLYEGKTTGKSLRRSSFENDRYYYTRIYTYTEEARSKELGAASKVLKWKINYRHEVESSLIEANDPVIVKTTTTSDNKTTNVEFGTLRVSEYDTFAGFSWSRPRGMTSSDYDGFMITLSKSSDMSDPIAELAIEPSKTRVRVTDLTPNTQYYAQGHFYEEKGGTKSTFGSSGIKAVKTINAIARDGSTVSSRNLMKIEKRAAFKMSASDGSTSATTTTSTSTTTSVNENDDEAVRDRIAEIKRQMRSLQSELNRLEDKIGATRTSVSTSSRTTTSTRTTSSSSSSNNSLSIRERLKKILAEKRAAKNQ